MSLRIALLTTFAAASLLTIPGCAKTESSEGESLGTSEDLLVTDSEADDEDEQSEDATDDALSGPAAEADLEEGPDPSAQTLDVVADRVKSNPGKFFQPAGCIQTTVSVGNGQRVATHVFNGCTGPQGKHKFTGTIVATWTSPEAGKLQVVREAKGFQIERIADGVIRTVDRSVTVRFEKDGQVYKKHRVVTMTGTSSTGKSFSRNADWNVSYDAGTHCIERSGSATTIFEGRELTRTVESYKRCGVGALGCPQGGKITITRKKGQGNSEKDISLVIEFGNGGQYTVQGPLGQKRARKLQWCRAQGN